MGRLLWGVTLACTLVTAASVHAQGLVFLTFERYLESFRAQAGIPGLSAAIVGSQGVVWEGAFGEQDVQQAVPTTSETAFHFDGVTQVATVALLLRCMENGRLSLDDTIGQFEPGPLDPDPLDPNATIREILTHTTPGVEGLEFSYRPDRLALLSSVVTACTDLPFRDAFAMLLEDLGMSESVPGPDAAVGPASEEDETADPEPSGDPDSGFIGPPDSGFVDESGPVFVMPVERYQGVMERLATPYRLDEELGFVESEYAATTLTATSGLVSTARDFARFDLALKGNLLVLPETRALAWRAPSAPDGTNLPHALGWFVHDYQDESVVWQHGYGADASSSLVIVLPARDLTLVLMANSDALALPFVENVGDLTASPFARLFLEVFTRQIGTQ